MNEIIYAVVAIISLVGVMTVVLWHEYKRGYSKARLDDHKKHEKNRKVFFEKCKEVDRMSTTRRKRLKRWLRNNRITRKIRLAKK